ncbi:MAG: heavy-metal-associated domain-containing protein [Clostridiales bacterium]|jgi:copper chaperone CopZ|nr:heavy-metal-associated domain-containing protein [Clostridiales bacterium]
MKKRFRLENLDCANCAAKMEDKISKLDGVESVSINFMTTKMTLEADKEKMPLIIEEAEKIIKKLEPHTKLIKA